ncbi:hypothetical protein P22_4009 [Propionispora sp. 2/2-37]|uniref:CRISPR-associated endonuclease Cas2 n=1 Tax=Propionispora sp. 2/2-37 TaxID=1677858 RepID=UPI0006BB6AF7|nr:CRISPR-associated endonuclease Cas2 [Propionispora sp. 2/2-37]CUH97861.1 hypothetical protein P22_4009 [Propionispora sp. 2/2-37]
MFIILVYDVNERRVNKVLKKCRQYLNWVQNSVLEGEISDANYKKLTMELEKIIDKEEDSVIIYNMRTTRYYSRQILGMERASTSNMI